MHLCSSLLKIKSIAASTELADELSAGIPKPNLTEDERVAFRNVTSALYNHAPVKQAMNSATATICENLNLKVNGKNKAPDTKKTKETNSQPKAKALKKSSNEDVTMAGQAEAQDEEEEEEETDFEGFESDVDEPGPTVGKPDSDAEVNEEDEIAKFDELLGSSSDEDEEEDEELWARLRGREKVNLDDISLSGSGSESESEEDESEEDGNEEEDEEGDGLSSSESTKSSSPPPKAAKPKDSKKKSQKASKAGLIRDSTFLPSLMGGYISGSESASDVDVAPQKKRLGQRSRQAIWEKKYGARAKHVREEKRSGGRDAGWDMRRGAVEAGDQGRRAPWKQGITNPLNRPAAHGAQDTWQPRETKPEPKPISRDDQGVLHPSWQAAKKAKEQKATQFQGQKIVFD